MSSDIQVSALYYIFTVTMIHKAVFFDQIFLTNLENFSLHFICMNSSAVSSCQTKGFTYQVMKSQE